MKSELMKKQKEKLLKEIEELDRKADSFLEQDTFKLKTNTAYIQNMKVFEGWSDFIEWIQTKHNQHWDGDRDSTLEVTFRARKKRTKEVRKR